jgi:hypothetical protein
MYIVLVQAIMCCSFSVIQPPLHGEVVITFADRGCCVVSATDPPVVSLGFLDRSRYYFLQVAPQLSSRG